MPVAGSFGRVWETNAAVSIKANQQITLAECARELRKIEVGHQVAAFDIDMCNPSAAVIEDLVAGPHHVLSGAQLDLPGPGQVRQDFGVNPVLAERRFILAKP